MERVFTESGVVHIIARTRDGSVSCPDCEFSSGRVHSSCDRCLADTPVGDQPVQVELTVRRLCAVNEWRTK
ncbi:hypothetical protein AB1484_31330 [Parafrankia sp. FMc6]|uniref:hypothetical protein n=1 Tax=Parafrankia soli TaxID=2599596 RepID=UPI0034D3C8CC